ncbi:MAG: hypothetical protein QOI20_61 [Acidimicrobiaceae bacterium]|nr:hypothetical protein [Acidimicrobiaceae bacterium]
MILNLVIDHRFYREADGVVFSPQNYNYGLFERRYLKVFEAVRVLGRVSEGPPPRPRGDNQTEGPGLSVVSLGDWTGAAAFLRLLPSVDRRLRAELEHGDATVVIAPGQLATLAARRLRAQGRPYGAEVIGDPAFSFEGGSGPPLVGLMLRWAWPRDLRRLVAGASAVAYVTASTLQAKYPPPPDAFTTHYSSIDLPDEAFATEARTFGGLGGLGGRPVRAVRLVTVAALAQPYKGVDTLITAVARCRAAGVDVVLTVVGEGRLRPALEAHARAEGVADVVAFAGQLPAGPAVRAALDEADVFVLASTTEGLPRVVIEAMARGLPCVATAVGGIPELLPPDALVRPGDPDALAARLTAVVGDPAWMAAASARNLAAARDYGASVLTPRRLALYHHLRAASSSPSGGHRAK